MIRIAGCTELDLVTLVQYVVPKEEKRKTKVESIQIMEASRASRGVGIILSGLLHLIVKSS